VDGIKTYLEKRMSAEQVPTIHAALVFTNDQAVLQVEDSPIPAVPAKKLKELIRKTAKNEPLALPKVEAVQEVLPQ
jgi:hypothetical protein